MFDLKIYLTTCRAAIGVVLVALVVVDSQSNDELKSLQNFFSVPTHIVRWNIYNNYLNFMNKIHKQDSVYVLASAIKEMITNETITEAPKDCDDSGTIWESGKTVETHFRITNLLLYSSGCGIYYFM